jgi:hypothetical protein
MSYHVLQSFGSGYPYNARIPVISPSGKTQQYRSVSANVINRSSFSSDLGLFRNFGGGFQIYTYHAGVATPVTVSGTDIFTTTANDGFLVGSQDLFNLVGFLLTQGQAGAPVYSYKYWNGSSWTALNTIAIPATYSNASEDLVVFGAPPDWVVGAAGGVSGLNPAYYYIWVQATTAPTQAVIAASAWVAQMIAFAPQVSSGSFLSWAVGTTDIPYCFNSGDGLLPYFEVSSSNNLVTGQYWIVD